MVMLFGVIQPLLPISLELAVAITKGLKVIGELASCIICELILHVLDVDLTSDLRGGLQIVGLSPVCVVAMLIISLRQWTTSINLERTDVVLVHLPSASHRNDIDVASRVVLTLSMST